MKNKELSKENKILILKEAINILYSYQWCCTSITVALYKILNIDTLYTECNAVYKEIKKYIPEFNRVNARKLSKYYKPNSNIWFPANGISTSIRKDFLNKLIKLIENNEKSNS